MSAILYNRGFRKVIQITIEEFCFPFGVEVDINEVKNR